MRRMILFAMALAGFSVSGAERVFDFGAYPLDQTPPGFRSFVVGRGKPGDWKIIHDESAPLLAPLSGKSPAVAQRAVLAQKAREAIDVHFPILIFDEEPYGDFQLSTRFKLAGGGLEQAAGIVFRFQNESNFFMVLASGAKGFFRCTKIVNGDMKPPIGPEVRIAPGVWHELTVECEGGRIQCTLNGTNAIKLVDNSATGISGRIGFCTRADAVSYFVDTKISFATREFLAQKIVSDALKEYSRLVDLKVYAIRPNGKEPVVVGSKNQKALGEPGGKIERDTIETGQSYYGKTRESVTVVLPLRDHNGDPMAAVAVTMKTFMGQTEDNALVRAQPILRRMQAQVGSLEDLLQ